MPSCIIMPNPVVEPGEVTITATGLEPSSKYNLNVQLKGPGDLDTTVMTDDQGRASSVIQVGMQPNGRNRVRFTPVISRQSSATCYLNIEFPT